MDYSVAVPNWITMFLVGYFVFSSKKWISRMETTITLVAQLIILLVQEHAKNHGKSELLEELTAKLAAGN